jgi:hypothetical protein
MECEWSRIVDMHEYKLDDRCFKKAQSIIIGVEFAALDMNRPCLDADKLKLNSLCFLWVDPKHLLKL